MAAIPEFLRVNNYVQDPDTLEWEPMVQPVLVGFDDVADIAAPADEDVLTYDTGSSKWVNIVRDDLFSQDLTAAGDVEFASVTTAALAADVLSLTPTALGSLPAGVEGMLAWVNDSDTVVWGDTILGGDVNKVLAVFNGTNWTVAGK